MPSPPASVGGERAPLLDAPPLRRVRARLRLRAALHAGTWGLSAALSIGALWTGAATAGWLTVGPGEHAVLALLSLPLLVGFVAALPARAPLQSAGLLDAAHGLHGLLASALEFDSMDAALLDPFKAACIARARAALPGLNAAPAAPFTTPAGLMPAVGLGVLWAGLASLGTPEPPAQPPAAEPHIAVRPELLHAEDLLDERSFARRALDATEDTPALSASAQELNALVEAIATRTLSRAEAMAEIGALEQRLRDAAPGDALHLDDALRELGDALDGVPATLDAAAALKAANAAAAAEAFSALAAKLDAQAGGATGARMRLLRRKLDAAAQPPRNADAKAEARARETAERLLRKRRASGQLDRQEARLLKRAQRTLEKLGRKRAAAEARKRSLAKLRRRLADSARALAQGNPGAAAERMREAAAQAREKAKAQRNSAQGRRMQQRLQHLRELLRRGAPSAKPSGKPGQPRPQNPRTQPLTLSRFGKAARGRGPGRGGREQAPGATPDGGGKPAGDGRLLLGGDPSEGSAVAQVQVEEAGSGGGGEDGAVGKAPASKPPTASHHDTAVRGTRGRGPTRSEVILEAAARGFASREYGQVHQVYQRHAEQALERDQVPGGQRYYVRRYFQLIRGREDSP